MTKDQLIRRIEAGRATAAELRRYADRVSRRAMAEPCTHGHFGCALVEGGPCMDEALANAEAMGTPTAPENGRR
jgi:hypothetical protein